MQIVRGSPAQAAQLSRIAWTAKARWGYPAHWMERWREFFTITPKKIGAAEYLVALGDAGQPVGFCAVCGAPGTGWRLEHLWVLPEWQGNGIGRRLFEAAVVCVRGWGGTCLDTQADPNAEGFYLRMGAVRTGETDATMEGIARVLPELRYAIS